MHEADSVIFATAHDAVTEAADTQAAVHALRQSFADAHVTFHLAQTVGDRFDAPFVRTTYPAEWVSRYLLRGYVNVDPVVAAGFDRSLPFEWSELEAGPGAIEMMQDAVLHGIGTQGYSVPVLDRFGRRALFSVNAAMNPTDWDAFVSERRVELHDVAHALHRRAVRELYGDENIPQLSAREREVLLWTARGKDYKMVAKVLNRSEHTIKGYLKTIRFKLDCSTIAQAVAKAIQLRIISGS